MKRFLCILLSLAIALSLWAFAADNENSSSLEETASPEFPVSLEDNTVIQEKPLKVAAISPAMTDLIKGLGFERKLVAMGEGSVSPIVCDLREDYPIKNIGTVMNPDLAALKEADPDVIFTHTSFTDRNMREIQQLGITIVEIPYAESFEDIYKNYETVCKVLLGETSGKIYADEKITRYKEILNKVSDISNSNVSGESAVYMRVPPLTLATGETFEDKILTQTLFLENIAGEYSNWAYPSDKTENLKPDIILHHSGIAKADIEALELYASSPSVGNGRIYSLKGDYFERRSPQMFMNLVSLMYDMYPDSMPEDLIDF